MCKPFIVFQVLPYFNHGSVQTETLPMALVGCGWMDVNVVDVWRVPLTAAQTTLLYTALASLPQYA